MNKLDEEEYLHFDYYWQLLAQLLFLIQPLHLLPVYSNSKILDIFEDYSVPMMFKYLFCTMDILYFLSTNYLNIICETHAHTVIYILFHYPNPPNILHNSSFHLHLVTKHNPNSLNCLP